MVRSEDPPSSAGIIHEKRIGCKKAYRRADRDHTAGPDAAVNIPEIRRVREVRRRYERQRLRLDGVVAVAIGTVSSGAIGLIVSVRPHADAVRARIPERLDDVEIEVRETGELRAL